MRRAAELQAAADALSHPYTYQIITPDKEKREKRKVLGKMAAEIIQQLADEYVVAAILELKESENVNSQG